MAAVKVTTVDELEDDTPVQFDDVDGLTDIVLVRTEGQTFAIGAWCSHADVPMCEGEIEDCAIECYMHGSMFDLRTGAPTNLPATEPIPVYPVTIDGDDVLVDVANPIPYKES